MRSALCHVRVLVLERFLKWAEPQENVYSSLTVMRLPSSSLYCRVVPCMPFTTGVAASAPPLATKTVRGTGSN